MIMCFSVDPNYNDTHMSIHTAIETNLSVLWETYESILLFIDLIMADLKLMDNKQHKTWTGVGNKKK